GQARCRRRTQSIPAAPVAIAFASGIALAPWARADVAWTTWLAALASAGALLLAGRASWAAGLALAGVGALGSLRGIAPPPLAEAQRLAAELRLYPATGLRNPGTFDYAEHLKREGIRVTATARADRLTPLDDPVPPWPARIKHESLAAISRALPPTSGAL